MFLIGSQAAKLHGLKFLRPTDENEYDFFGTHQEYDALKSKMTRVVMEIKSPNFPAKYNLIGLIEEKQVKIEFDATDNLSNQLIRNSWRWASSVQQGTMIKLFDLDVELPPPNLLYAIKRSHANFDVNFDKTMSDVIAMKKAGWDLEYNQAAFISVGNDNPLTFQNSFERFSAARHAEAKARHGKKQEKIKLNKSNEDFFKGGEKLRFFEHDDLHKTIAFFPGYPMFVRSKLDPNSAKMDRALFENLPWKFRIYTAMEESMVLGLERVYIPETRKGRKFNKNEINKIYQFGAKKMILVCKNWFQDFAIDNILEIMEPGWDFIAQFEEAKTSGKLKELPLKETSKN